MTTPPSTVFEVHEASIPEDITAVISQESLLMLSPMTCVADAIMAMKEARTSFILATETQKLVGIFTERDVVRLLASQRNLEPLTLADLMTRTVLTLKTSEVCTLFEVTKLFKQHRIRHIPVLDDQEQILGVVTPHSVQKHMRPENLLRYIRVQEVMVQTVIQGLPTNSLLSLIQKMSHHRVSCIVICQADSSIPIGIITERDVIQFRALDLDLDKTLAETFMSTPLSTVHTEDALWSVHQKMRQLRVRRLVVVSAKGELAGIVTQTQMLKALDPLEMYQVMQQMQDIIDRQTKQLQELNAALQTTNQQLNQLAIVDELTQIPNRRGLKDYLKRIWPQLVEQTKPVTIILGDIDHFKHYNDIYGHPAGDCCITQVAQMLLRVTRNSTDFVARYGGEEFVIVLPDTPSVGANRVAKEIIHQCQQLKIPHRGSIQGHVTLSLGVMTADLDTTILPEQLLQLADQLLYQAKHQGRNTYRLETFNTTDRSNSCQ